MQSADGSLCVATDQRSADKIGTLLPRNQARSVGSEYSPTSKGGAKNRKDTVEAGSHAAGSFGIVSSTVTRQSYLTKEETRRK